MLRILLLIFALGLYSFSNAQIKQMDKLEMLYAQKHFKMVLFRANRLLDKPDYDFSQVPKLYKSLALFQLAKNSGWYKRNNKSLKEAVALFEHIKNTADGEKVLMAHMFEVAELKEDLSAWGEELKRMGKDELAAEVKTILLTLFNRVPNIDDKKDAKPIKIISDGTDQRSQVIAYAQKQLGVPYQWAGTTTKGFDCSGFTSYVYAEFNITLPRRAEDQFKSSNKVKEKNVQKGDLIFFSNGSGISHVGIVTSNPGEPLTMIHASSSQGIVVTNVEESNYWQKRISGFGAYLK